MEPLKKLKIFFCLKNYLPLQVAGTEIYVAALCRSLQFLGHDVRVIKPNYNSKVPTEYIYENTRVMEYPEDPLVTKNLITGRSFVKGLAAFKEILQNEKPDVLHFHEISGSNGITIQHYRVARSLDIAIYTTLHLVRYVCKTSTLLYKNRVPCDGVIDTRKCAACLLHERGVNSTVADIIAFAGDTIPTKISGAGGMDKGKISALLSYPSYIASHRAELENIFRLSNRVFVLNEWFRDILMANNLPASRMIVLPRARSQHSPAPYLLSRQPKNTDLPVRMVFMGRISKIKGVMLLIQALNELSAANWELDIYGKVTEPDYYEKCRLVSKGNTAIHWKGVVDPANVLTVLEGYDLLVFPTLVQEMAPLTTLEAFAAGVPVLASGLLANKEEIRDGVNGWLFNTGDLGSLKDKLEYLLAEPGLLVKVRQQMPIAKPFTLVAEIHEQIYSGEKERKNTDRPLKILHCLNHFLPKQTAGTEVYTWALCKGLHEGGIEAEVAIPNYGSLSYSSYVHDGIKVHQFAEPSTVDRDLQMGFREPEGVTHFMNLVQDLHPDVVHFHELAGSNGFTVAHVEAVAQHGIKTMMTFHLASSTCKAGSLMYKDKLHCDGLILESRCSECMISIHTAPVIGDSLFGLSFLLYKTGINLTRYQSKLATAVGYPFIIKKLKHDLERLAASSDKLVVLTHWYQGILKLNGVPAEKIHFNPQGLIQANFTPPVKHIEQPTLRLIFVGRISHFKGVNIILDAMAGLAAYDITLDIYGSDPHDQYSADVIARMQSMSAVKWLGKISPEAVVETMCRYDLLVLASTFSEMSPLVIQEAFAAGIPVLASDVYGNAEQITPGKNGWLFKFKDAQDLARILEQLSVNRDMLLSANQFPVARPFESVVAEYIALYTELVPKISVHSQVLQA